VSLTSVLVDLQNQRCVSVQCIGRPSESVSDVCDDTWIVQCTDEDETD